MEYENNLREGDKYTEMEIQEKIEEIKYLSKLSFTKVKIDDKYKSFEDEDGLIALKGMITDDNGEPLKNKITYFKNIEKKLEKIKDKKIKEKHKKALEIDESQLDNFKCVLEFELIKQDLISKGVENKTIESISKIYDLANVCLKSKQCNEPYEILLSAVLRLINIDEKHGFDAVLTDENGEILEVYEYKPSSNTNNPSGTINDDSIEKIEKCENLDQGGGKGWLVLAGIDKDNFTFNSIYKFPLEIYNENRRKYFDDLKKNNSSKEKQTRSIYGINIKKSIGLCHKYEKEYYVWER